MQPHTNPYSMLCTNEASRRYKTQVIKLSNNHVAPSLHIANRTEDLSHHRAYCDDSQKYGNSAVKTIIHVTLREQ